MAQNEAKVTRSEKLTTYSAEDLLGTTLPLLYESLRNEVVSDDPILETDQTLMPRGADQTNYGCKIFGTKEGIIAVIYTGHWKMDDLYNPTPPNKNCKSLQINLIPPQKETEGTIEDLLQEHGYKIAGKTCREKPKKSCCG